MSEVELNQSLRNNVIYAYRRFKEITTYVLVDLICASLAEISLELYDMYIKDKNKNVNKSDKNHIFMN